MKKMSLIFFALIVLFTSYSKEAIAAATQIWDEFPLVRDTRNFKESTGGKGVPAQGRIISESIQVAIVNEKAVSDYSPSDKNWRYVVSMNCRRGGRSIVEIMGEIEGKLIPEDQQHRLAVVLGINERVIATTPLDSAPSWADVLGGEEAVAALHKFKIPILLVYFQWTSFRESKSNPHLSAHEVRRAISDRIVGNERQKDVIRNKLNDEDATHQFPFGKAREFLLQNSASQKFIADLHQKDCGVYIHIQDSDFGPLQENLLFGDFQGDEGKRPISAGHNRLLAKYDALIAHHQTKNGRSPIVVGGAHVYSPEEDLKDYLTGSGKLKPSLDRSSAKNWTRFTSEMGNNIKHIIGQQQPYGLYFHEPNTLILSPFSAKSLLVRETLPEWRNIYTRLAGGFSFGIDSEIQALTRSLFKGVSDSVCRQGMVFSSPTVLSTSMKSGLKPFTIKFGGEFDAKTRQFVRPTKADLKAIRGMKQETITTNDWGGSIATSFASHRVSDARPHIYAVLRPFDPIEFLDPADSTSFLSTLIEYDQRIQERRVAIGETFRNLQRLYNKQGRGDEVAFQIISAGWETGQIMRSMFLNHLQPPTGVVIPAPSSVDQEISLFLSKRFNFVVDMPNPFVAELLGLTLLGKTIMPALPVVVKGVPGLPLPDETPTEPTSPSFALTPTKIAQFVTYLDTENKEDKRQTGRDIGVDYRTVPNLMNSTGRSWKKVAETFGTPEKVRHRLARLDGKRIDYILGMLAG
jgi:hypothetical protein